jgi:hypothetical protein
MLVMSLLMTHQRGKTKEIDDEENKKEEKEEKN